MNHKRKFRSILPHLKIDRLNPSHEGATSVHGQRNNGDCRHLSGWRMVNNYFRLRIEFFDIVKIAVTAMPRFSARHEGQRGFHNAGADSLATYYGSKRCNNTRALALQPVDFVLGNHVRYNDLSIE